MRLIKSLFVVAAFGGLAIGVLIGCQADVQKASTTNPGPNPYRGLVPTLSSTLPAEVPVRTEQLVVDNRPFFDYFSWQSFIALSWPARDFAHRGQPLPPNDPYTFLNANRTGGPTTPVVWGTFREAGALFPADGSKPVPWDSPEDYNPCASETAPGLKQLASLAKGGVFDEVNEAFSRVLIDQNRHLVRYEIRVNQEEYDTVRQNGWYLKANVPAPPKVAALPNGSVEIKAGWRKMTKSDDQSRYYVVDALILDPTTKTCVEAKMGLVALHIIQKTPDFQQWVWSSFEHVDNVKIKVDPMPGLRPSFNNGKDKPVTIDGYDYLPPFFKDLNPDPKKWKPVQVTRFRAIPKTPAPALVDGKNYSTQGMNKQFQRLLEKTVWKYYELVVTQWPSQPETLILVDDFNDINDYDPFNNGSPFPIFGANTAAETYFQASDSCMQCHYGAATGSFGSNRTDYSWILNLRPYVPKSERKIRKIR